MERCAEALLDCADTETTLVNRAVDEADEKATTETEQRLITAKLLYSKQALFLEKLAEFTPVPESRTMSCRCGRTDHLGLPGVFAEQTTDLSTLLEEAAVRLNYRKLGLANS